MVFPVFVTVIRLHLFNYISIQSLLVYYQQQRKSSTKQPDLFNSGLKRKKKIQYWYRFQLPPKTCFCVSRRQ